MILPVGVRKKASSFLPFFLSLSLLPSSSSSLFSPAKPGMTLNIYCLSPPPPFFLLLLLLSSGVDRKKVFPPFSPTRSPSLSLTIAKKMAFLVGRGSSSCSIKVREFPSLSLSLLFSSAPRLRFIAVND